MKDTRRSVRQLLGQRLAVAGLALWLLGAHAAAADDGPRAPCGATPVPGYAGPGAAPNLWSASSGKLARDWAPQACTSWTAPGFDVLVAVAGSFRYDGEIDDLLARIGAISLRKGVRYWSTMDKAWLPLVIDAYALSSPDAERKGPDFGAAEMAKGQNHFYAQSDNRSSGKTVYRLRVLEVDRDRLVFESENVTAVRKLIMPLFGAGDLQAVYFLERRSPGVWNFYSLTRTRAGSSVLSTGSEASYINRAVAFYRHVAGIPTDLNPPAAP